MDPEQAQFDDKLAGLAGLLRDRDRRLARRVLADLATKLDRYIRTEEQLEWPAQVHAEHAILRRLVAAIAIALDQSDDRRALEGIGTLRSVLLLHLVKEELLSTSRSRVARCHPPRS